MVKEQEVDTLFVKRGRRYIPARVVIGDYAFTMKAGSFMLVHAYSDGGRMYHYEVKPDTASFYAAAQVARLAMVEAMRKASPARAQEGVISPYTKRQKALIEKFRQDMADAGGLVPPFWQYVSLEEIAQAGIDAVGSSI